MINYHVYWKWFCWINTCAGCQRSSSQLMRVQHWFDHWRCRQRKIILQTLVRAKFTTPVTTLLSPSVACFLFLIFCCVSTLNEGFVPYKYMQPYWAKPLLVIVCMSGFQLHFNRKQIRERSLLLMRSVYLYARCSWVLVLHIRGVWLWVEPCILCIRGRNDQMRGD